ncbi:MAG TPA: SDR family oxidoreductase [Geodermatophilus sp.]|nr:SDR family oxidoreductase [Geodermatophilus sp.]
MGVEVDVTDADSVGAAVDRIERELGPVAALVTAAGVYEMLPVEDVDDARWHRTMAVNLARTATTCAAVVPRMVARGRGSVVTISSDLGVGGSQGDVHYAASKGALVGFTRALVTELEGTGVAVNTVAPGAADTPMLGSDSPWRSGDFLATLPVQRLVRPEEIAARPRPGAGRRLGQRAGRRPRVPAVPRGGRRRGVLPVQRSGRRRRRAAAHPGPGGSLRP